MNGLNDLSVDDGVKEVQLPAKLTPETLTDMKFEGGRPVVINEHVAELNETGTSIFFGDLKRALIVGEKNLIITKIY